MEQFVLTFQRMLPTVFAIEVKKDYIKSLDKLLLWQLLILEIAITFDFMLQYTNGDLYGRTLNERISSRQVYRFHFGPAQRRCGHQKLIFLYNDDPTTPKVIYKPTSETSETYISTLVKKHIWKQQSKIMYRYICRALSGIKPILLNWNSPNRALLSTHW